MKKYRICPVFVSIYDLKVTLLENCNCCIKLYNTVRLTSMGRVKVLVDPIHLNTLLEALHATPQYDQNNKTAYADRLCSTLLLGQQLIQDARYDRGREYDDDEI